VLNSLNDRPNCPPPIPHIESLFHSKWHLKRDTMFERVMIWDHLNIGSVFHSRLAYS
jgi:hypothetical protein